MADMPSDTAVETRLILSDDQARSLAAEFGTPLYVVDEKNLRERVRRYRSAFEAAYPNSELTFASKANSTLALLRIIAEEGCLIDVASEGEFRAALMAGVSPKRCHLHGNNKSRSELEFAFAQGIAQIVVDCFEEIDMISTIEGECPELVIRLAPGVDPKTNAKISTGQADTKFGFNIADGSGERALARCLELGLPVAGFHCHVGSQLLDPGAQISGGEIIAGFCRDMKAKHGFETKILNVGGGLGVRYMDADRPMEVEEYCRQIVSAVVSALEGSGLSPKLVQEPGRSLIAEAGVTLYTVGAVKTVPSREKGQRSYVAVDGGLSDNPRPALYGSLYSVRFVAGEPRADTPLAPVTISGKHCETDRLFEDVELPNDVKKGDLIQVLCTGAYNSGMASNYNRYQRPATALLPERGQPRLIQRRDSWDEMFARELID